ncbi:5-oxoprolinase/urea amidolyase family protein [Comamonas humi]
MLKIVKPGLATTVQDGGRPGHYNVGIPLSGALDQYALRLANLLVGNDEGAAVLECTLLAAEIEFTADGIIAIAGAETTPKLNGSAMPLHESFAVKAGDKLTFDFMKSGARLYIAVAGGIDVPQVLGSRSTYGLGAFGGYQGRKLAAGDVLPVGQASPRTRVGRRVQSDLAVHCPKEQELRVLPGIYDHNFTDEATESFYSDTWTVGSEADRIGYRFKGGRALPFKQRTPPFGAGSDPSNIVDAGYPYGCIQVPAGQEPIILHRDAVSGGGYAMIGVVVSADMNRIAQMQPNYKTRFVRVDMAGALAARAEARQRLDRLRAALAD